jgi:hypothetical protein
MASLNKLGPKDVLSTADDLGIKHVKAGFDFWKYPLPKFKFNPEASVHPRKPFISTRVT